MRIAKGVSFHMSRTRSFSIYLSNDLFKLGLVGNIVFLFIVLMQFYSNDVSLGIGIGAFSPGFLVCGYLMLKTKLFRVVVHGETINVRTVFRKYSFNVSEISEVWWQVTTNGKMESSQIRILTKGGEEVKIESLMIGSEKIEKYLVEHVEADKIHKHYFSV